MKKLVYIPFVVNVILLVYLVSFVAAPRKGFLIDVFSYCWGDLNMQYIYPTLWIALLVSLVVPVIRTHAWLRVTTPLLAIGNIVLLTIFWSIFHFP